MKKSNLLLKRIGFIVALLLANLSFSQNETKQVTDTTKSTTLDDEIGRAHV